MDTLSRMNILKSSRRKVSCSITSENSAKSSARCRTFSSNASFPPTKYPIFVDVDPVSIASNRPFCFVMSVSFFDKFIGHPPHDEK